MSTFRLTLTGTQPLIMHSSRLADPLDPATKALKEVTAKRKKTDDDHEEVARLEWLGSLYFDDEVGPYLPGQNIERALVDAAKQTRQGRQVQQGVFLTSNVNPVGYAGPRTTSKLWADPQFRLMASVGVMGKRVMRCRPMFKRWAVEAEGTFDPSVIDAADLSQIAQRAGERIGVGDWRPRYGRFDAELEVIEP